MKRYTGFKLLIVDDHEHNLFTLRTLIERHMDVQVFEADSGQQAIDIALHEPAIDLIILDVQMPGMDGFQTASMLKIRSKTKDIPIIFLTAAFKTEAFQQKGYEVGAVDYLLKPIDDNQLINKISTYFRLIEKERGLNRVLEQKVKERTAELAAAKRHLENILTHMGEALLLLNPEGEIESVNPAACEMLSYPEDDLVGMTIADIFEEEEQEQAGAFFGTWLEALIRTGALNRIEARFIAKDGRRVPILFSRTAVKDEAGELQHIICIAKDMTGYVREEDAVDSAS
ncbi:response regulator [Candidatus Endoriftia persephone]|jgi:PAS domain S-box-containing protein|uniref:Regulatory protein RssB n=5 Tax=Gammaproteobacteria TaxID=1236 RepID=G2FIC2_9GAMM|nr:response regulator [Candidatus Endoriftia persephone]AAB71132.1 regulatory protein RssB [endosymbiont of Riftia pachyptila]EGV52876.1 regulatory protein RssB [endosymbiont of Riftia pachyptila (vent Ph05)]EGW53475.1 regulatory protein RssB [endosymbiont of Tevnia jerichonana (vent Tica)]USF87584.1 response regulator [Candidatus Endoriftia persephone]